MARDSRKSGPGAIARAKRPGGSKRLLARLSAAGDDGVSGDQRGADRLIEDDLAERRGDRLFVTEAGRARATRESGAPEPFLSQHRALGRRAVRTERGPEDLLVDLDESPLAWLARRKGRDGKPLLAPAEVAAGEKLRADFTRAQMSPRVTANWEAAVASGRRGGGAAVADITDAALGARMRVGRAIEAVGPELAGVMLDVCCFLKGVEEVERDRGWPARGAKLVLGLALARLARHYGMTAEGTGGGRVLAWGAPGSRPTFDGT